MDWKRLDDLDFADKTALVRVDLNVPTKGGQITDTTRIDAVLPTIRHIIEAGGRVVLLSHFGRPKGQRVPGMSLAPVAPALAAALGMPVAFAEDCIGLPAKRAVADLPARGVLLLENTRFHPGEETNDQMLAAGMAALGDIYVNDAFSAAHRAHASTEAIARLLPACAGRLMEAELKALEQALGTPARPVVAIVGGAKISTKLELLGNLVAKVEHLVIGGGMANTFLAAQGRPVGTSLAEHDLAETAREILAKAEETGCTIHLPQDLVVAPALAEGVETQVVETCPDDMMILDTGPASVTALCAVIDQCQTLIWNGPLGAFETKPFDAATLAVARHAATRARQGKLIAVAGGGDTVAALNLAGVTDDLTHVSTAGGAFLEWMEGKTLPGVAALAE